MSFPGFSLARQGPVRIGGQHDDFDLFVHLGSPFQKGTLGFQGLVRVILEADFVAYGTQPSLHTNDNGPASGWKGAFSTGAWPVATRIELYVSPGALIAGYAGNGGSGGQSVGVGGNRYAGGGGGAGAPAGGTGGVAIAPATNGANGSATAGGAHGLGSLATSTGGGPASGAGEDGGHGLIIRNGITLDLFNFGEIRGGGGGGTGGNDFDVNGGNGAEIHSRWGWRGMFFTNFFGGYTGGWARYSSANGAVLNKYVGATYPNVWGFEMPFPTADVYSEYGDGDHP